MLSVEVESMPEFVLVASFPGGTARQFRVQVFNAESADWQMYANFAYRQQADACWRMLTLQGHQARIIDGNRAPSAA